MRSERRHARSSFVIALHSAGAAPALYSVHRPDRGPNDTSKVAVRHQICDVTDSTAVLRLPLKSATLRRRYVHHYAGRLQTSPGCSRTALRHIYYRASHRSPDRPSGLAARERHQNGLHHSDLSPTMTQSNRSTYSAFAQRTAASQWQYRALPSAIRLGHDSQSAPSVLSRRQSSVGAQSESGGARSDSSSTALACSVLR